MMLSVQSTTEATIGHLEIAIITKKRRIHYCFSTHLELFTWNSSQKERL
jgi:hypothetical protein